ncbi:MAG: peroxidase [Phycisphaerales bacterium]|nr:peroxidase [Phycisphaerales bacterium]MCB9862325.1 peroxidase [Phycisphaerales bacterium]
MRDWTSLAVSPAVTAVLEYASKITKSPANCNQDDVDLLRRHGWSDCAIHDAVQIVSYFNYINRIADALGVEPEPEFRNWGSA